jgi:hypothetical protein
MINQCLLYRYIISYEPYNFKGRLEDFPETLNYGRKMDALRTELREFFWDGEFRDTVGAHVTVNGKPHQPYSVFISQKTGKPGLVVANYAEIGSILASISLDNGEKLTRYRLVDTPQWQTLDPGVQIPPCSAAVVL